MKLKSLLFGLLIFYMSGYAQEKDSIITLKYTLKDGFVDKDATTMGNFMNWEDLQMNQVVGVPDTWKNVKLATIIFDEPQYYYQQFLAKQIDSSGYALKAAKYKSSSTYLVNSQIKCYVYIIAGANSSGEIEFIIDSNANNDFNDDERFNTNKSIIEQQSGYLKKVAVELPSKNGISKELRPVRISYSGLKGNLAQLSYNFPSHAVATFDKGGQLYELKFASIYSIKMNFLGAQFYVTRKNKLDMPVEQEKFVRIGDDVYENIGIDIHARELQLKKIHNNSISYPKVGFYAPAFSVKDVVSGATISLDAYKGKYVFIDFWATWCPPCIESLLTIKNASNLLAKNNVASLAVNIASKEDLKKVKDMILAKGFIGDQAYSDELTQMFKVGAIPANFLIDPSGKIVGKDIDVNKLASVLKELIK